METPFAPATFLHKFMQLWLGPRSAGNLNFTGSNSPFFFGEEAAQLFCRLLVLSGKEVRLCESAKLTGLPIWIFISGTDLTLAVALTLTSSWQREPTARRWLVSADGKGVHGFDPLVALLKCLHRYA